MTRASIKWSLAGVVFGAFGYWALEYAQKADRHTMRFGRNWLPVFVLPGAPSIAQFAKGGMYAATQPQAVAFAFAFAVILNEAEGPRELS